MSTRTDKEIIEDLKDVECQLSPENLSCDGELSASQTQAKAKRLHARWKKLLAELGRTPTNAEMLGGA